VPVPTRRVLLGWAMAFGPALLWVAFAVWRYGPTRGYGPVLALAVMVGVGVVGLTVVFIAYFPATLERFGLTRFAAWVRTWWDEDAR
jgi:hypothetical protein